jgi:AAA domain
VEIRRQEKPVLSRISILLYGFPKIGKTTQAAKIPQSLILSCEPGGTDFLTGVDVAQIHNLHEFETAVNEIGRSEYRAVVVDGFTWMVNQAAKLEAAKTTSSGRQQDGRRVYGEITDRVLAAMGRLLDANKIVVATGHSRKVPSTDGTKGKDDIRPDLNEALADDIFGAFSIVCYCFPSQGGSKMLTQADDNSDRRIYAGARSRSLDRVMPLDMTALLAKLKAEYDSVVAVGDNAAQDGRKTAKAGRSANPPVETQEPPKNVAEGEAAS